MTNRRPTSSLTPSPRTCVASGRRRAMTITELLLVLVVIGLTMGGLLIVTTSLRAESAEQQTRRTLRALGQALSLHHQLVASGRAAPHALDVLQRGPTHAVLSALLANPATAAVLREVNVESDANGSLIVRDGYGRAIRYLPPAPGMTPAPGSSPAPGTTSGDDTAGAATSGSGTSGGDFVSAGPDGRFGDTSDPTPFTSAADLTPSAAGSHSDAGGNAGAGATSGGGGADNLYASDMETLR